MSGAVTAAAIVGAAATVYSVQQQRSASKDQANAMRAANDAAQKQNSLAEQQINAANRKRADVAGLQGGNRAGDMMGGGTLLTGPTGVDPNQLQLGKQTLLGG